MNAKSPSPCPEPVKLCPCGGHGLLKRTAAAVEEMFLSLQELSELAQLSGRLQLMENAADLIENINKELCLIKRGVKDLM